jgi:hypothetical protein
MSDFQNLKISAVASIAVVLDQCQLGFAVTAIFCGHLDGDRSAESGVGSQAQQAMKVTDGGHRFFTIIVRAARFFARSFRV